MAFPTTSVLDTFAGGPENPLATNWSGVLWPDYFNGHMKRASGTATGQTATVGSSWYDIDTSLGADTEAYIEVDAENWSSGEHGMLFVRCKVDSGALGDTSVLDGYLLDLADRGGSGSDEFEIERLDNGSATVLGATVSGLTLASGDQFGIEIIGSTIKGYYKVGAGAWTEKISRTDSTHSGAGAIGMLCEGDNTDLDNFGGGTVVGAAAASPGMYYQYYQSMVTGVGH
jgi:hypothetical protein